MKRIFEKKLAEWNKQKKALPIMLIGARQTGKTYLLKAFCKETFEQFIYL